MTEKIKMVRSFLASLKEENDVQLSAETDNLLNAEILFDEEIVMPEYCDCLNCDCGKKETSEFDSLPFGFGVNELHSSPDLAKASLAAFAIDIEECLDNKMGLLQQMWDLLDEYSEALEEESEELDEEREALEEYSDLLEEYSDVLDLLSNNLDGREKLLKEYSDELSNNDSQLEIQTVENNLEKEAIR